ncbi:glycerophosphodiester phosphodiesterase [Catenovulum sp. SM1970]|uniref:glycerophosphodiester phosphodiesterase n=1 Tax=Marinifaba aquimaris TaxID=2741323 RepID=UPI0015733FC3|nr:glycerophosphodiester phosphodiesterase family protein [Marinifaba aquimaris]NTS76874.1 glycerophosphodiester phosphodiesterase [Marinifaba aquimaris]
MWIFAHRGASGHAPENTLKAIQLALDMNCHGIEIDVHEIEGELLVIHNRWLMETTNGDGHVHQHSLAHLRTLDAGHGQSIPTLREVLELIKGHCVVNIEVKSWATERAVLAEIEYAIKKLSFRNEQIILSSFNHQILAEAKRLRPATLIGALTSCIPLHYAKFAQELKAYSVNCCIDFVDRALVKDAHSRGIKVLVYTVNEEVDMKAMQALGVDGIFTNYPSRAVIACGLDN